MAKRTVSAREFAADIRAGMTDEDLIHKYNLNTEWIPLMLSKLVEAGVLSQEEIDARADAGEYSEFLDTSDIEDLEATGEYQEFEKTIVLKELDRLDEVEWEAAAMEDADEELTLDSTARKVAEKTGRRREKRKSPIPSKEIVRDVRSGMDDTELMNKYDISQDGLDQVLNKLVQAGLLEKSELEARRVLPDESLLIETAGLDEPSGTANISDFAYKLPRRAGEVRQVEEIPGLEAERDVTEEIGAEVAEALQEFAAWWSENRDRLLPPPAPPRPRFPRKRLVKATVELSAKLVRAAEKKAAKEKERTGGNLESLLEVLLWEYLDRDPRFTE